MGSSRFTLGVTAQDLDDTETMRAGDRFVVLAHSPVAFRVVEVATGEPIEPGPPGIVTVPRDGVYRLEPLCRCDSGDPNDRHETGCHLTD